MSSTVPNEFRPGETIHEAELTAWLGGCGRGVKVFRGCRIVGADRVRVGDFAQIDEGVHLFAGEGIDLGRHVHLAFGSSISGGGRCVIRDHAGIGAGVRIITGTEDVSGEGLTNPTIPAELRTVRRSRVTIGAHTLVFTGTLVLPGVTVGDGAVVAAGSIVHHDLRPWGIYAGNPLTQVGVRPHATILSLAEKLRFAEDHEK